MMEIALTEEPYAVVSGDDGTEHALWLVSEDDSHFFSQEFEKIPHTYIADGHHRAASAFNVGNKRREEAKAQG